MAKVGTRGGTANAEYGQEQQFPQKVMAKLRPVKQVGLSQENHWKQLISGRDGGGK